MPNISPPASQGCEHSRHAHPSTIALSESQVAEVHPFYFDLPFFAHSGAGDPPWVSLLNNELKDLESEFSG